MMIKRALERNLAAFFGIMTLGVAMSFGVAAFVVMFGTPRIAAAAASKPVTVLVEAEAFQFHGNWHPIDRGTLSGGKGLGVGTGAKHDAITAIELPGAGTYSLWVRAKDYAQDRPGIRRYRLLIDDRPAAKEAGNHGHEGWYWQKVGSMRLDAGRHMLSLHDTTHMYGRCDAILLTTTDLDPNSQSLAALAKYRIEPFDLKLEQQGKRVIPEAPAVAKGSFHEAARIGNDSVRIIFLEGKDASGSPRVVRQTQLHVDGHWQTLPVAQGDESLLMIYSDKDNLSTNRYWPVWTSQRQIINVKAGGHEYSTVTKQNNPFLAGKADPLVPRSCRRVDDKTVEVTYRGVTTGREAVGRWQVRSGMKPVRFQLTFTADKPGNYSIAYSAFQGWDRDAISQVLLPPMYQYQRLPKSPEMVTSSVTPHPIALVQKALDGKDTSKSPFTFSVIADPADLPFRWATATNAPYGFSLLNAEGKVQPTIFSPVLGMVGSKMKAGEHKTVSWYVLAREGDWEKTIEDTSTKLFKVTDYRKPVAASLTDAALNVIDLMKNAEASGWDAGLKGFYNIESKGTVTQAAPLAVVSAAILTHDEQFYADRALPSIEFTLSRPSAHFSREVSGYVNKANTKIHVPSKFFGASYWQGLDQLLDRANPWIPRLMLDKDGKLRHSGSYSTIPAWSPLLAAYRLHPSKKLLEQVKTTADAWITKQVYGRKSKVLGLWAFYNISFYPYWWELPDLYDITGDQRYLDAAQVGAFYTIAGLWVHPLVPNGDITVHPKGEFLGENHLWWKGDTHYRLGYPRHPGDTPAKQVPAWEPAQVGLALEEPATYYAGGGHAGMRNITMAAWAPHLLRMYGETGREIYRTFARNAIIGRFANYPGYYIRGYTDLYESPDYPYTGPDVTSIYYHHIPPMLAFTLDFLVTEAHVRTHKKISFPYVRQQGYAWFADRIFGAGPGRIFDDRRVALRLDRKNVHVDSKDVNYLIGRGENQVWLILMNDVHKSVTPTITIDAARYGIKTDQPYRVLDADGKVRSTGHFNRPLKQSVPAMGLVAISFPTSHVEVSPKVPPLKGGRAQAKLDGDWGALQAFRIRGPFGHDALYVVLTGRPKAGSKATLVLDGHDKPVVADQYPYEFSVYPWAMDRDMTFHVELRDAVGHETKSKTITVPGT